MRWSSVPLARLCRPLRGLHLGACAYPRLKPEAIGFLPPTAATALERNAIFCPCSGRQRIDPGFSRGMRASNQPARVAGDRKRDDAVA